jgi:hypothetical protein
MVEGREVRDDRFVGDRWIVERERANKVAIARNAMGGRRLATRNDDRSRKPACQNPKREQSGAAQKSVT